ncbi:DUF7350 domain-containing protein [Halostagnicola kamekurae]|uniref:Tat (Twin-arginine translocation) pathway signal sequence n=1 Tax=Halostagnicola kamekurae TaxID=619731 RepID=A0A1I6NX31_9EURY|nr:twin-arginine translocation signal domain-containing protein [Halostagnicola kamekurae]SFS32527.1 Tat (twin-arginine translocation) pathway signal sequence [Halostagnicola kamekurae]
MDRRIDRRRFLVQTGAAAGAVALAGCTLEVEDGAAEGSGDPTLPQFYEIQDKPDAVYLPTHREAMKMLEPVEAGEYTLAPMLSYVHPFWIISGDEIEREEPDDGNGVHLMVVVWDTETGVVLPVDSGAQLRVKKDGEQVGSPRTLWTMISQQMGFHFGDNVPLADDGTYTAELTLPPLDVRTTGELEGKFAETETASFEFEYDQTFRNEVATGVEYLDREEWGDPGALEPMRHGGDMNSGDMNGGEASGEGNGDGHVQFSALPPAEEYPGAGLEPSSGEDAATSSDAVFVTRLLESGSRFVEGSERYLLVSPRTPYNRVPLADMSMTAAISNGEAADSVALEQTIDGEYGIHYGAALAGVEPGSRVTIEIDSFPQVARHQGYDTAFFDMPPVELTVPESIDS